MKATLAKTLLLGATLGAWLASAAVSQAQDRAEKLVEFKNPSVQVQKTPDWDVKNIQKKRWVPKDWLEFEVPFVARPPADKRDAKVLETLSFKYYLFVDSPDKDKKRILTADVNYLNVPVGEPVAGVVYLPSQAIVNLTGTDRVTPGIVSMWGVEAYSGSQIVGFASSRSQDTPAKPWWKMDGAPPMTPGTLLPKSQTPFAPLWFDYHAQEQK